MSITFTPGGNRLVYSNHPESILGTTLQGNGVYTIETALTPNYPFIHDFYHFNSAATPLIIGVAVQNTTSSPINVRVLKPSIGYGTSGFKTVSANMHLAYERSAYDQYISISGNTVKLIEGAYVSIAAGNVVNGRVWLNATASGLKSRIIIMKTTTNLQTAFSLPRALNDGVGRTTALFTYDTRYGGNISLANNPTFLLCETGSTAIAHNWQENKNEFPVNASDPLAGSNFIPNHPDVPDYLCDGNFSVYYSINFTERTGKYITIKPLADPNAALYMMNIGNGWVSQQVPLTGLKLNCANISNMQFVLTGSNYGKVQFTVTNS